MVALNGVPLQIPIPRERVHPGFAGLAVRAVTSPNPISISPWPYRFALAMTVCTLFLVLFGGSVTTMGAGMAVKGWIDAEGHFMPLFPIAKWTRDPATFVEHTHRMIGIVVGLLAIASVVATHVAAWPGRRKLAARGAALLSLAAICIQGAIGGTRVLENSQSLAFLHGAVGQLTFVILWCTTLLLSPAFQAAPAVESSAGQTLFRRGRIAALVIYGQIMLGAWFRHAYRISTEIEGADDLPFPVGKFLLHGMGAMAVLVVVLMVAKSARNVWEAAPEGSRPRVLFRKVELFVHGTFYVQLILGTGALSMLGMERTAMPVVLTSTLHVLFGALTLSACASAAMWGLASSQAEAA